MKTIKLSRTMQDNMDAIHSADWYYQHNGKGCEHFATANKVRNIGHERTAIVEGGLVYARMSSSTLEALSKRGLVEVKRDGREWLDIVHVPVMELPERLTKALKVKITRTWPESKYGPQLFDCYAVNEAAVQHLVEYFSKGTATAVADILGEIELGVWDFFKNE